MLLSVVMPVFNENKTVREIVERVIAVRDIQKEIVLVDDASTDGTIDVLNDIVKNHPEIKVVLKKINSGKGSSVAEGIRYTKGDLVIIQDADLEYDPRDYKKLLEHYIKEEGNVIYGSRFLGISEKRDFAHYLGNKFLTFVTNTLFGVKLSDMETCYKLIPGNFVRGLSIKSKRFDFEPEITAKILKAGLKIKEIPISYSGRKFSEGKKITWRDGILAILTLIRFRFTD